MDEEYLSFEKVLRELKIEEEELKRLVSAGEIKAYREADKKMQFKPEDVEKLKDNRPSDPDVIELLDSGDDLEIDGEPTVDLGGTETTEELSFDDVDFGDDLGLDDSADDDDDAELFDGEAEEPEEEEELDLGSLDLDDQDLESQAADMSKPSARIRKSKIAGMAEEEEAAEPQWVVGLMAASTLILLIGIFVMMDIASSTPSALVGWLVGMFQ